METREEYCTYVFTKLLDIERIRELYAREFEQIGIAKIGNYVGSIVMEEVDGKKQIRPILNYSIGQRIEKLPATQDLHNECDRGYARKETQDAIIEESRKQREQVENEAPKYIVYSNTADITFDSVDSVDSETRTRGR